MNANNTGGFMTDDGKLKSVVGTIDRFSRILRGLQFSEGLNPAQWEAVRFIASANKYSATPSALTEFLGSTKGTVSQTIIALEKKGLVSRERQANDKRSILLKPTEKAISLLKLDPLNNLEEVCAKFSEQDLGAFHKLLEELFDNFCRHLGAKAFGVCDKCHYFIGDNLEFMCGYKGQSMEASQTKKVCINYAKKEE